VSITTLKRLFYMRLPNFSLLAAPPGSQESGAFLFFRSAIKLPLSEERCGSLSGVLDWRVEVKWKMR
jgi:hypothetical protein